jgi:hypothetical protein
MSNPLPAEPESTQASPKLIRLLPDYDDDENDADDSDDDGDGMSLAAQDGWFSRSGFGSPEWWSHQ